MRVAAIVSKLGYGEGRQVDLTDRTASVIAHQDASAVRRQGQIRSLIEARGQERIGRRIRVVGTDLTGKEIRVDDIAVGVEDETFRLANRIEYGSHGIVTCIYSNDLLPGQ